MTDGNAWTYLDKEFNLEDHPGLVGCVYIIVDTVTYKLYVGKKMFYMTAYKQVKGKRKRIKKESDWENYWGSSPELLADIEKFGKDRFRRRILHLCKSKSEQSYWETYEIFSRHALLAQNYYNKWCSVRVNAKNLKNLLT